MTPAGFLRTFKLEAGLRRMLPCFTLLKTVRLMGRTLGAGLRRALRLVTSLFHWRALFALASVLLHRIFGTEAVRETVLEVIGLDTTTVDWKKPLRMRPWRRASNEACVCWAVVGQYAAELRARRLSSENAKTLDAIVSSCCNVVVRNAIFNCMCKPSLAVVPQANCARSLSDSMLSNTLQFRRYPKG